MIKRIAVYCASSTGNDPKFKETAYQLGKILAEKELTLVYGGGNVGLMGAIADGVVESNGKSIGVLPHFLAQKELAHNGLAEMILVDTMHERKAKMGELADGFIALPGGFGTMEELFEMLTWAQLALHKKPIAILNINGFYDALIEFIEKMIEVEVLKPEYRSMLLVSDKIDNLLDQMNRYVAPKNDKWFVTK